MISDSIEQRRTIKEINLESDKEKIFLTPEIIDQIPYCLEHLEIINNQKLLRSILVSLEMPEPYGINTHLYQIAFGEKDSSQQELLDDFAQDLLFFSSKLESFPFLLFSNEKCIVQLLSYIDPSANIKKKKKNCAKHFLCSIFDHNHERDFIGMPIYEELFRLIYEDRKMFPILISILLNSEDLPKDIFTLISPIVASYLELDDILKASSAMLILNYLQKAQIEYDLDLIIKCEEKFIDSIDEKVILQLMNLMKYAPEPPFQCLNRILKFIDNTCDPELIKESLYILKLFGEDWDEDQKDQIAEVLMSKLMTPQNVNFIFISMTVEILLTIDRLPVGDFQFFTKVIDLIDVWDNLSIFDAINTIITKTMATDQEMANKMLLFIKTSRSFELLVQDKNSDIANNAQDFLKLIDSYIS